MGRGLGTPTASIFPLGIFPLDPQGENQIQGESLSSITIDIKITGKLTGAGGPCSVLPMDHYLEPREDRLADAIADFAAWNGLDPKWIDEDDFIAASAEGHLDIYCQELLDEHS